MTPSGNMMRITSAALPLLALTVACSTGAKRTQSDQERILETASPADSHSPRSLGLPLPASDAAAPTDRAGLSNLVAYAPGLISGGAPEGEAGFESIAALGVSTIISVDGAKPDVALARKHGLRYIHLPIGYNGMNHDRTMEIAKAIAVAEGPVYLHCHHGKHRSAGAAAAAAVTLGLIDNETAEARMKVSGTAPAYMGLYACAAVARPASPAELAAIPTNFPEVAKTTGLVDAMVEIDEHLEHLKAIEKAGWRVPADHPDLVPAAEAGRLADLLRNLRDDERAKQKGTDFTTALLAESAKTEILESTLTAATSDPAALTALLAPVAQSCKDCHTRYRD